MKGRKAIYFAVMAMVLALLTGTQTQAAEVGFRGYVWFPSLSADARGNGGFAATTTNLTDTLGLGNKAAYSAEVFGGMGKHHLSFMYTSLGYSDTKSLGRRWSSTVPSTTRYGCQHGTQLKMYDLKYQYDLSIWTISLPGFPWDPLCSSRFWTVR
jgi:hypothetical protein